MKDTRIVSSPAVTAVRISPLLLANRNFMPARALPMPPLVVPPVVPPGVMASLRCRVLLRAAATTMRLPAPPADDQHLSHSSHVKIVPSIVVIASRLNAPLAALTAMTHAVIAVVAVVTAVTAVAVAVIDVIAAIIAGNVARPRAGSVLSLRPAMPPDRG